MSAIEQADSKPRSLPGRKTIVPLISDRPKGGRVTNLEYPTICSSAYWSVPIFTVAGFDCAECCMKLSSVIFGRLVQKQKWGRLLNLKRFKPTENESSLFQSPFFVTVTYHFAFIVSNVLQHSRCLVDFVCPQFYPTG